MLNKKQSSNVDLSVTYMGLELRNPIVVSSSKLTSDIKNVLECAEQGAGAVVLKSLFEEQLLVDPEKLMDQDQKYYWFPEAVDFVNGHARQQGFKEYLELIKEAKASTSIPILGSINCTTPNEWPKFASKLEEAGIDGLELNISIMPFDENLSSQDIEDQYVDILTEVKKYVRVPIAVKISCMFTNTYNLVKRLELGGADAVVLFNRLFQPDIDIENERVVSGSVFSNPEEITAPLRWVTLLAGRVNCDLAGNTGIHTADGVVKHLLAGAAVTQVCTALYQNGIDYISEMIAGLSSWAQKHNYSAVSQFQGKLGRKKQNLAAFTRVQYMKKTLTEF
jgi:dihydroorotate dehydrogenase (fumarate)